MNGVAGCPRFCTHTLCIINDEKDSMTKINDFSGTDFALMLWGQRNTKRKPAERSEALQLRSLVGIKLNDEPSLYRGGYSFVDDENRSNAGPADSYPLSTRGDRSACGAHLAAQIGLGELTGLDVGRPRPCRVTECSRVAAVDLPVCARHLGQMEPEIRSRMRRAFDAAVSSRGRDRILAFVELRLRQREAIRALQADPASVDVEVLDPVCGAPIDRGLPAAPFFSAGEIVARKRYGSDGPVTAADRAAFAKMRERVRARDEIPCCVELPCVDLGRSPAPCLLFTTTHGPELPPLRALPESEQRSAPSECDACGADTYLCPMVPACDRGTK